MHITSHCLSQLLWLFITTSSHHLIVAGQARKVTYIYPVIYHRGRKWDVWRGSVLACTHTHSHTTTPQSLANLQSHAGVAEYSGSLNEKHTLCTAGPDQPRPEGTTLKDIENWGRELPSFPLAGQAEKKGKFPKCLWLSEAAGVCWKRKTQALFTENWNCKDCCVFINVVLLDSIEKLNVLAWCVDSDHIELHLFDFF